MQIIFPSQSVNKIAICVKKYKQSEVLELTIKLAIFKISLLAISVIAKCVYNYNRSRLTDKHRKTICKRYIQKVVNIAVCRMMKVRI